MLPINEYIFLSLLLFSIGVLGVIIRRNAIVMLMCVELMLNATNLLLVAFSKMHNIIGGGNNGEVAAGTNGQLMVFFVMVVAAAEVAVGLAIIVLLYRKVHNVNVDKLNQLKY